MLLCSISGFWSPLLLTTGGLTELNVCQEERKMFQQLTEQMKNSSQPASNIFAANIKTLQVLSQQQTVLLSGVLNDGVKLIQSVAQQTEVNGYLAAQSVYAKSVKDRFASSSKTTISELNKVGLLYAENFNLKSTVAPRQVAKAVQAPQTKASSKKPVAKKASAKQAAPKAEKVVGKPASKTASPVKKTAAQVTRGQTVTTKPATKNPVAKTAKTNKTTTTKVNKKPAVAKNNTEAKISTVGTKKAASKTTATKTVPKLDADGVRASKQTAKQTNGKPVAKKPATVKASDLKSPV